MKKNRVICCFSLLLVVLLMCCSCKETDLSNDKPQQENKGVYTENTNGVGNGNTDSTVSDSDTPEKENKTIPAVQHESYKEGDIIKLLNFDKGLDMYGEKSINIIGDSISQGQNSEKMYNDSWASLFKNAINKKYGSNNMGFVSLNSHIDSGVVVCDEIHKISIVSGDWQKRTHAESSETPGNFSYTAGGYCPGADLRLSLNRKQDGIDRHINGFYIYYVQGSTYGSFKVKVNGKQVADINCSGSASNPFARSKYISIPAGCGDDIAIDIIKSNSDYKIITINGIAYMDKPGSVTVNNYSLSGISLLDIDDGLLSELSKANVVIFTLGTNDAGLRNDIDLFRKKLNIVSDSCRKNGSLLIVGDVIWPRYGDANWANDYKKALKECATAANGYYVDFVNLYYEDSKAILADNDICHPTVEGHKRIAKKLCKFLGI